MAQLAIKAHPTRTKEVIEILEMLGGKNRYHFKGDEDEWFVLNENIQRTDRLFAEKGFTLEEFLEKFPYKAWDKVSSKYLKNYEIEKMEWDDTNNRVIYKLRGMGWYSADELQPYKEETMKETLEQITLDIPDGYEFFGINDDNQVVLAKIQPQYPKTYVECAKTLNCFGAVNIDGYKGELLDKLQELIICRDAYWKIAGDWKPDYMYCDLYCIGYDGNVITWKMQGGCRLLAFPTEEMRDAFYENFKELIELVKELL